MTDSTNEEDLPAPDNTVAVIEDEPPERPVVLGPDYHVKPFELVPLKWEVNSNDDLPVPEQPYFLWTKDGMYLVKEGFLGISVIQTKLTPPNLGTLGNWKNGVFWYKAKPIPADVTSQAVDFFRQVWNKHKTEAEVLIIYNEHKPEGSQYRLFIPAQRVSGGSVHSAYAPEDIPRGWFVIGSMHSHCNFSAFHSGTDTNDAATFNGVHITVGFLQRDKPEFAVMVSTNGEFFHYKSNIEVILDVTDLDARKAPEQWMNFLMVEESVGRKIKKALRDQLRDHKPKIPATVTSYGSEPSRPQYPYQQSAPYYSNMRLWKRTGANSRRTYYNELRASFPDEWFTKTNGYQTKFDEDHFTDALSELLDDLGDVAEEYGFDLQYSIVELFDEAKAKADDAKVIDGTATDAEVEAVKEVTSPGETDEDFSLAEVAQMLPGPMEVSENPPEPVSEHRAPLIH